MVCKLGLAVVGRILNHSLLNPLTLFLAAISEDSVRVMSHDVKWREFINTNGEVPERILLKSTVEDAEHNL